MQTRFTTEQLRNPEIAASEAVIRKCVHCGYPVGTGEVCSECGNAVNGRQP